MELLFLKLDFWEAQLVLGRGSVWRRWEPHIHAPGTALNNQFGGEAAWDDYIAAIEDSDPKIEAIGITDYYLLDTYEKFLTYKSDGRLKNVGLIFPNIELRLATGTARSRAVNFHLLIDPTSPDHVAQAQRFLSNLKFRYKGEKYGCNREDLMSLGRAHSTADSDAEALRIGVNQFKVEFDQFSEEWGASEWIRRNALIAVATNQGDGTSGLQSDSSLEALRRKIETEAHIMFASSPKDRAYWLGKSDRVSPQQIIETYGALKPCIHGSDAHSLERVGKPDKGRYTWVKGDLSFESLRQTCMEPELRARIGADAPSGPIASQVIESLAVHGATWFPDEKIPINAGLVGIIGARGSGKTALADMIAAGAQALSGHVNERSFIQRAQEFITDEVASVAWGDGDTSSKELKHIGKDGSSELPKVQYLSQQFVENLCSASGATDELVAEIKRVIFGSHAPETRQGAIDFDELLDLRTAQSRQIRSAHEGDIKDIVREIAFERDKVDGRKKLISKIEELRKQISSDEKSKAGLISKDNELVAQSFESVTEEIESKRQSIAQLDRQKHALKLLQSDVSHHRDSIAPAYVRRLSKERHDAAISEDDWTKFVTEFVGDVDALLAAKLEAVTTNIAVLTGKAGSTVTAETPHDQVSETSVLPDDTPLSEVPLRVLEQEQGRLEKLIGANKQKRKQLATLTENIATKNSALNRLQSQLSDADSAPKRIENLLDARGKSYASIFDGILSEEAALRSLYEPLDARLKAADGAVAKLSVSIRRHVDVEAWAQAGEELLDLRKGENLRGRGALLAAAQKHLLPAWQAGDGKSVALAMQAFRDEHDSDLVKSSPYKKESQLDRYRVWATDVSRWMYGTEHISVSYSLTFENTEIERLSPGTRGIVLLLLYLAIDQDDERPLIIDQPEENLDPKSIFDELVQQFRIAKQRRQIIIVTHNANLIVNTDVDQVIVANSGPHNQGELPKLTYHSGSLESADIRSQVCAILEGGEQAFRQRALRLRLQMPTTF